VVLAQLLKICLITKQFNCVVLADRLDEFIMISAVVAIKHLHDLDDFVRIGLLTGQCHEVVHNLVADFPVKVTPGVHSHFPPDRPRQALCCRERKALDDAEEGYDPSRSFGAFEVFQVEFADSRAVLVREIVSAAEGHREPTTYTLSRILTPMTPTSSQILSKYPLAWWRVALWTLMLRPSCSSRIRSG
jgi:hypothetical protein